MMTQRSLVIVFLIRSLQLGGAQRQLVELARGLAQRGHAVTVLSFYDGGPLVGDLTAAGVVVKSLGKTGRWDLLRFSLRLARAVRAVNPDVVHGYTPVPNLFVSAVASVVPRARIVWGVRVSRVKPGTYGAVVTGTFQLSRLLQRTADLVIANSERGASDLLADGYPASRVAVVPNGIDSARFVPDPGHRARTRAEWGIAPDEVVLGTVGRVDPQKDHATLLRALEAVMVDNPQIQFVSVGEGALGAPGYRDAVMQMAASLGMAHRTRWIPARVDIEMVYPALDLFILTSIFEGFPNVLGEAMACGVPCVTTDVGDGRLVVGDTGMTVPPENPAAVADAVRTMLERLTPELRDRCRARIASQFSVDRLVDRTEQLLLSLCRRQ